MAKRRKAFTWGGVSVPIKGKVRLGLTKRGKGWRRFISW